LEKVRVVIQETKGRERKKSKISEKTTRAIVNPVRNSSGALNPAGIIIKSNPAVEQRGIISNGVNHCFSQCDLKRFDR